MNDTNRVFTGLAAILLFVTAAVIVSVEATKWPAVIAACIGGLFLIYTFK
jgi:K+-sensing histidine kinase KdpD